MKGLEVYYIFPGTNPSEKGHRRSATVMSEPMGIINSDGTFSAYVVLSDEGLLFTKSVSTLQLKGTDASDCTKS